MNRFPTGKAVRTACRTGTFSGPTAGHAPGDPQANLVVLPAALADDFRAFCHANPKPCPILDETKPGNPEPTHLAPGADLRYDLPAYLVWENGICVAQPLDIERWWRDDLVGFLLGCSFTFEDALMQAGIGVRHIELGRNVPMYRTNIACTPVGPFAGPLVVSMRPIAADRIAEVIRICEGFPQSHGAPVHVGDPAAIGVTVDRPDYGDAVPVYAGEVPVFWACGVTPQAVVAQAKLPFVMTHQPGHMFVGDRISE